jgi:hypothetical protein
MTTPRCLAAAFAVVTLCSFGRAAPAAPSVVYTVNSKLDLADFDLGDGIVDADPVKAGEQVTLRAALQNANLAGVPVEIDVPAGTYKLKLKGREEDAAATGDLDVTGDVTIVGAGAKTTIVDARSIDRVLQVHLDAALALSDVTLTHGNAIGQDIGNVVAGGGVRSQGALTMTRCTVSHCHANDNGGALYLQSGPTLPTGATTLTDCTLISNVAGANGGGISSGQPSVTVANCTIAKNRADQQVIHDSGFDAEGGGVHCGAGFVDPTPRTLVTMTNCTVSGNKSYGDGGGVTANLQAPFKVELVHCTIALNTAKEAEGIAVNGPGSMSIANCVLYKNDHNCSGNITSLGGNVELGKQCGFGTGDLNDANAKLGPLKNNGGSTPTHALGKKSAAIGAGKAANCVATDQRGQPRKANCDAGAFETP